MLRGGTSVANWVGHQKMKLQLRLGGDSKDVVSRFLARGLRKEEIIYKALELLRLAETGRVVLLKENATKEDVEKVVERKF